MKNTFKKIDFDLLKAVRNVRTKHAHTSEYLADGRTLVESICQDGLQDPIMVVERDGFYEIVRGHRRTDAIAKILAERPEEFARLFPSGKIPCQVISNVTNDEILKLKVDFNRENLADRYEIVLTASALFDAGETQAQVACSLANVLGEIVGNRKKRIAELTAKMEAEEDALEKRVIQRDIDAEVAEYRRGKVQGLRAYYDNPSIVMDCLYFETYGTMPEGYEDTETLPVLTQAHVKKLAKCWKEDLDLAIKGQIETPTKVSPSHNWVDLFQSIKAEIDGKVEKAKDAPRKSMSRNDIIKPLEEGKISSKAMKDVISLHAADKSVSADVIVKTDRDLQIVQFAKSEMSEQWAELEKAFASYEKKVMASALRKEKREAKNDK